MNILITGVPGWLGNRFLEILIKGFDNEGPVNNWKIRCLSLKEADTSSIDHLLQNQRVEKVIGDITKMDTLMSATKDIDIVFHIAGIIHPKRIKDVFQVNELGTENIIKASMEAGAKRFIYISSNSAAGPNEHGKRLMVEEDALHPYFNYGLSKYRAECIVKRFQESSKIETVILRPCWFYGPYQPERQTTFFRMIRKGNPIIFGNGNNLRSLSYVDDICNAMLLSAENKIANGRTYWIADATPYPTNDIYKTVAELLDVKEYKPIHLPNFVSTGFQITDKILQGLGMYIKEVHVAGEMNKDIACSIEKARKELGFKPKSELKIGMKKSIEWCRQMGIII